MDAPEVVTQWGWSETVAIASFGVAILSAIISWFSSRSAHQANRIAIHDSRLRNYLGIKEFSDVLTKKGFKFKREEYFEFGDQVYLSEFYFPEALVEKLKRILSSIQDIDSSKCMLDDDPDEKRRMSTVEEVSNKSNQARRDIDNVLDEMKQYLKVVINK